MPPFVGWSDIFSREQDILIRGKLWNGRSTFYLCFIPVYSEGFNHSTGELY